MARGKRPKPARGASPAMDLKLDGEFWAALHEAARLDTAGDPAAAAQHMRAWRDDRKRRDAAAASAEAKPDDPAEPVEPTDEKPARPDRFAQYVEDWSEEEEEAFHLGMELRREREARRARQELLGGSPDDDASEEDAFHDAIEDWSEEEDAAARAALVELGDRWRAERAAKEQTRQDALGADSDAAAGEDVEDLLGI